MSVTPQMLQAERAALQELGDKIKQAATPDAIYGQLCSYARRKGYKMAWADHAFEELFGSDIDHAASPELIDWIYQKYKIWAMERKLDR